MKKLSPRKRVLSALRELRASGSLRVMSYNFGDGPKKRKVEDLRKMIEEHQPDVIALQEAGDQGATMREVELTTGYVTAVKHDGRASHHVALLIAPWARIDFIRIKQISPRTRVGRRVAGAKKTGYAEPKWIIYAGIKVHGKRWVVGSTHHVPSRFVAAAERLGKKQARASALWMRTRLLTPVLSGDFNCHPLDDDVASLRKVADWFSAASHKKRWIDITWVRKRKGVIGGKDKVEIPQAVALDGYSSDHRPLLLDVVAH